MFKKMMLIAALCLSTNLMAASLADSHSERAECESCHKDKAPSADLAFENQQCISCHGEMKTLTGEAHAKHDGVVECTTCHIAHEEKAPADSCKDCH
ncbi:cytochrome c3 family protein [Shewanella sp. MF08487]|uniref:cytochrome c3 family protein n=1 Tax=Shewanella sp. MF08487 TaxID=3434873 RepID=UPI003D7A1657